MSQVRAYSIVEGLIPSERVARITTIDGTEEVILPISQVDGDLVEAWVIEAREDRVLVELPRETSRGAWRIWVSPDQIVEPPVQLVGYVPVPVWVDYTYSVRVSHVGDRVATMHALRQVRDDLDVRSAKALMDSFPGVALSGVTNDMSTVLVNAEILAFAGNEVSVECSLNVDNARAQYERSVG